MQLSEWVSILHEHHITETDTLELFNTAVSHQVYADLLTPILIALKKLDGDATTDLELYSAVMEKPWRAGFMLKLIEELGGCGASLIEDYDLCVEVVKMVDHKEKLRPTLNLLKRYHLKLPECSQHYRFALTLPFTTLEKILGWLEQFNAILPQDSWLYLLALKNASFIVGRENIFALFKQRGITAARNSTLVNAVLHQCYQPEEILKNFDTLDLLGFNLITNEKFYIAATGWLVRSDLINQAFDILKVLGADLVKDPELFEVAIKSCGFIGKFTSGFTALKNAGIGFSAANKELYLDCLDNPDTSEDLEQGFAALVELGIDYALYPLFYQTMVKHSGNISTTVKIFSMLKEIGASLSNCESLYLAAMRYKVDCSKVAQCFAVLKDFDFILPNDEVIYEKAISFSYYAKELRSALQILKDRGVDILNNQDIVLATIDALPNPDELPAVMSWFEKMNLNNAEHSVLYLAAIENIGVCIQLFAVWDSLDKAGFGLANKEMYLLAARHISDANQLDNALTTLIQQGATASSHKDLFTAVIEAARFGEYFQPNCVALNNMGVHFTNWDYVYLHAAKFSSWELSKVLERMSKLKFNMMEHADLIQALILGNRHNTSLDALTWLEEQGFQVRNHPKIYGMFFLHKHCLCKDPYVLKKVEDAVGLYLLDKPLVNVLEEGFTAQYKEIKGIIAAIVGKQNEITQGPLNKSAATQKFEQTLKRLAVLSRLATEGGELVKQLAAKKIEEINMSYDPTYGYVLTLNDEVIYINELMRLVNFSHLELDRKECIIPLGKLIERLVPDFNENYLDQPHAVLNSLPLVVRQALYPYIGWYYKNINRTFRGLAQSTEQHFVWVQPADGRDNLLANFLCGCLVNWTAAELPRALNDLQERQILKKIMLNEVKRFQAEHGTTNMDVEKLLHRMKTDKYFFDQLLLSNLGNKNINESEYASVAPLFEQLDLLFPLYAQVIRIESIEEAEQEGHFNVRKVREANPVHLPSVMSTSSSTKSHLGIRGNELTLFAVGTFDHTPTITRAENELLSPLGASFLYSSNNQGVFFAREVNSPNIVPQGGYWSSLALIEANRNHLKNSYKEQPDQTIVDDITIARANHGLPHEYRVMLYIDMVIEYYSLHGQSDEFKYFCQQISFEEREWLRVAAAYSVTGRESEIGALDNLARYEMYREASCKHLGAFLQNHPPAFNDSAMAERILYVVRWMGNPFFESGIQTQTVHSANSVDEKERQHRNFLIRILSTAHKLDLPRCYIPEKFEGAMSLCRKLSHPGELQQRDYIGMMRYSIELIRAHGDMLRTDINAAGELIRAAEDYRSPFGAVQSLRTLHEVSSSVSRPKFEKIDMEEPDLASPMR